MSPSRLRFARRARLLCWASLAPLALTLGASAGRQFQSDAMNVRMFEPPPGWELSPQATYPRLLAAYAHAEGGRLTLSAERVPAGTTAAHLAAEALAPLEKQGFKQVRLKPFGDRARLSAELDGGRRLVHQLYVVEGGIAYVITIIGPRAAADRLAADFEAAIASLKLGAPPDLGTAH